MTETNTASIAQSSLGSTRVAVLDIGSNSFHLVVVEIKDDQIRPLQKIKHKVRLAEGLSEEGYLSEEAIRRGLSVLKDLGTSIQDYSPHSVRLVATYTLRRAKNAHKFIKAARKILPYPVEVISGQEEARLIYKGVAHTNELAQETLVIDIGGGSTEFALGKALQPMVLRSLDMGCVSFTQKFFKDGKLTQTKFQQAITAAQQQLARIEHDFASIGWRQCIGTSGSVESMISMYCEETDFSEHKLTLVQLENLMEYCLERGRIDRLELGEVNQLRTQVFPAGLSIMIAIFRSLGVDSLNYVTSALREGVIYEMDDALNNNDIRGASVAHLALRYDVDREQVRRVESTALELYQACQQDWELMDGRVRALLCWGAQLHEIGGSIQPRNLQKHSFYILKHANLPGFNAEQQAFLALLVRFHCNKIKLAELPELTQFRQIELLQCLILLRLAVLLNVPRKADFLPKIELEVDDHSLSLNFPDGWLAQQAVLKADLQQEQVHLANIGFKLSIY